jgi:ElaB/YqjD/DUF883 family membrane-anchored ribosome-binding protein
MTAIEEKDIADQIETIRAEIASLTKKMSLLVSDTAGIRASLARSVTNAAKSAVGFVNEAEEFGGEALHAAVRGATAAVGGVQQEIERNPLPAVIIAAGFGFICGFLSGSASRPAKATTSRRGRGA